MAVGNKRRIAAGSLLALTSLGLLLVTGCSKDSSGDAGTPSTAPTVPAPPGGDKTLMPPSGGVAPGQGKG